jgi:hypothetical protein
MAECSSALASVALPPQESLWATLLNIFEQHNHPIIIVGNMGMRWMGVKLPAADTLEVVVRTAQVKELVHAAVATGMWSISNSSEEKAVFQQTLGATTMISNGTSWYPHCLRFWPEESYKISVGGPCIEVPDCTAWNPVLVEEKFHPDRPDLRFGPNTITSLAKLSVAPTQTLSRASMQKSPLFIPSIPRMLEGLLQQSMVHGALQRESEAYYNVENMIRYLFLERPNQRDKVCELLSREGKFLLLDVLSTYKRKLPTKIDERTMKVTSFEPWNLSAEAFR